MSNSSKTKIPFDITKDRGVFANRLRALRKRRAFSQKQVAAYLGMSPAAYGYYERGERTPTAGMLIRLSQLYHGDVLLLLMDAAAAEHVNILPYIEPKHGRQIVDGAITGGSAADIDTGDIDIGTMTALYGDQSGTGKSSQDTMTVVVTPEEFRLLTFYWRQAPSVRRWLEQMADKL